MSISNHKLWLAGFAAAVVGALVVSYRPADPSRPKAFVFQKGRQFSEKSLAIAKGDVVRIVNDDEDLRHHAYVDAPAFRFDTGDQEPGSTADIAFSVPGSFEVLCGIHPKMKMQVVVK